jgi:hypothetical protein
MGDIEAAGQQRLESGVPDNTYRVGTPEVPQSRLGELLSPVTDTVTGGASVIGQVGSQLVQNVVKSPAVIADYALSKEKPTFSESLEKRGVGLPSLQGDSAKFSGEPQVATPEAAAPTPTPQTPQVMANGTPTSASGIGTSVVNDVNFLQEGLRQAQGMTPQVPTGGLTTQSGIPLSQFLSGEAIPEAGLVAESPMFAEDSVSRGLTGEAGREAFAKASAEREAGTFSPERTAATVSDRERRAARGEGLSMADAVDLAGGDRAKARAMVVASKQPQAEQEEGLTFEQQIALSKEQRAGRQEVRDVAKEEMEWEKTQGEARQKRTDEMNTEIGALTSIIGQAENIGGVAQEAGRQVGAGTTGFFSPLKWIGGTTAADLAGNLETIKSDAFVANITEMRQNSPTGGAVGNVSDKDLEMLQSLQTSFRQNLKPTTLRNNLKKYKEIRDKVSRDAKAGFIRKYGKENFNKHFGDGGTPQSESPSVSQPSGNSLVDKWNK